MTDRTLTNRDIAELLARKADEKEGDWAKILRRTARRAYLWPEEAADLVATGRPLTELHGVGPAISAIVGRWLDNPPPVPAPDPLRVGFLTLAEARRVVAEHTGPRPRGDLQMHTLWSDGGTDVVDMVRGAAELGHEYIAITDHSKGLKIANGIDEAALARQAEEIAQVNAELRTAGEDFTVLHAMELNLSPQGEGDMESAALARLDLVLGSFHSQLRKKEDQTERYLAAVANPDIQVLGHPRGRIFGFRAGLSADWARVFARVAELGKAVEVDCNPARQDLDAEVLRLAAAEGCYVSIGTDAHSPAELPFIELGLATVVLAGVPPGRILNNWTAGEIRVWAAGVRKL